MQTGDSAKKLSSSNEPFSAPGRPVTAEDRLTDRELTVAELVASGTTNTVIARKLSISPDTVGQHVRNLLRKTGASTRAELIARLYVSGCFNSTAWPPERRVEMPRTCHSQNGDVPQG